MSAVDAVCFGLQHAKLLAVLDQSVRVPEKYILFMHMSQIRWRDRALTSLGSKRVRFKQCTET